MHNNYHLLRHLTVELQDRIVDAVLRECFSQNKDELIFRFTRSGNSDFFIKAHLRSDFSCLSFPENFRRARKNSVDLFTVLAGKQVKDIYQYVNERSFSINFVDGANLLFKMHGNRANVILFQINNEPLLFRNKLANDRQIDLSSLDRHIDQSFAAFQSSGGDWPAMFPTLSRDIRTSIQLQTTGNTLEQNWLIITEVIKKLNHNPLFAIINATPGTLKLVISEKRAAIFTSGSAIEALNFFFDHYIRNHAFGLAKDKIVRQLSAKIKRTDAYINKIEQKRNQLAGESVFKQAADVLMANLHTGASNSNSIELFNFYTNKSMSIKLNPKLSLQKNAEHYYRKAKNINLEIENIRQNLEAKKSQLAALKMELGQVQLTKNLKELKGFAATPQQNKIDKFPFMGLKIDNYQVFIGKNARQNDLLTLKYAKPNDLWLHAKDVTGSHVIIKHRAGQNYPKPVIEKAARLAAYYSKRKNDTLCPVIYTPKKFVRKRKGLAPGAVIVEQERVILVEPSANT